MAARRQHADLVQAAYKALPILRVADRLDRRAEYLHAMALEHPTLGEREAAVERGLAARRQHNGVRVFALDHALDEVRIHGDEVHAVGEAFTRLYGRDIGIDENNANALFLQSLYRLRSGIVELAGLADLERAASKQ